MVLKNRKKKIRFLITGGAGFLGVNLCRFLVNKGHFVRSLDIANFDYNDLMGRVDIITGDIRDKEAVKKSLKSIDLVIHCAAALPLYPKKDIFSIDVFGTKNLIEQAFNSKIKHFIHISSTAVYGIPDHHPIYEHDKLRGVGPYGEAKIRAERVCMAYRKKGMTVSILRPKSFIGPERLGVFALFYDWAKDGRSFPMIGSGKNRYQLLDVEDLCEAIYLCATKNEKIVNSTFNIGAEEFTTMKQDYQAVLDKAGFGKKIKGFPAMPMIFLLRILEAFKLSPLYKWVYETASKDSFVSIEKAEKELGFKPKYSNKEALIRNYTWYLQHYNEYQETGISHRAPWKQGILSFFKIFF